MKKHIAIITAAVMAFSLTACNRSENKSGLKDTKKAAFENSQSVEIANPYTALNSSEEIEKQLGIKIDAPRGADDIEYAVVDGTLADIRFSFGGDPYTLRASKADSDISGLFGEEVSSERLDNAILTTVQSGSETYLKLTWTDGEAHYSLTDTENGNADKLKEVYALLK